MNKITALTMSFVLALTAAGCKSDLTEAMRAEADRVAKSCKIDGLPLDGEDCKIRLGYAAFSLCEPPTDACVAITREKMFKYIN